MQAHGLSRPSGAPSEPEEHRAYVAEHAGDIWYGDVMHGPRVPMDGGLRKAYLVSLMDDASRLIVHSAFRPGETALDIEAVLKQAVLKRGLPVKLVIDNGPAYRAKTLQGICARLGIHLVYCRPYHPEGKGKLERWHRTFRNQFLSELDVTRIGDLEDLNARLWAWLETVYHRTAHSGLDGQTPLARYQQDLARIRTLGALAARLDALFHHRVTRLVRNDGTVSYQGTRFEVPYELSGQYACAWWSIPTPGRSSVSRTTTANPWARPRRWMHWPMSIAGGVNPERPRRQRPVVPTTRWRWPTVTTTITPRRTD